MCSFSSTFGLCVPPWAMLLKSLTAELYLKLWARAMGTPVDVAAPAGTCIVISCPPTLKLLAKSSSVSLFPSTTSDV